MAESISVILPVLIRDPSVQTVGLLQRAIESVLAQDYPEMLELIVVDDGSPVPVAEMTGLRSYRQDPRMRWIRFPRNTGLPNALNVGLRSAQYDFIARIDADDRWRDGKIPRQIALFRQDPDLTIVGTGMCLSTGNHRPPTQHVRPGSWAGLLRFFVEVGCPFPHGSIVGRRDIFTLLGGYPHDRRVAHAEDFALWGVWLRFFKPAMVEEVFYDYALSETSVSTQHEDQQRRASGLIHRRFLSLNNSLLIPDALAGVSRALGLSLIEAGRWCFLAWKYSQCVTIPEAAIGYMRQLMPDRAIRVSRPSSPPTRNLTPVVENGLPGSNSAGTLVDVEILPILPGLC